ncbi:cyanophycinase [Glaciecola sp. XM2]|uniref:cyanophycinase n=1 Tax=Glaciecola sp. XM2 TaxID=1914931 RepID=UPI001BDE2900|nr:cyanophycinase [Glaciecola sp. XM2]MBT1449334.1 cyanophycinase [Glaciecola sp. XM2]
MQIHLLKYVKQRLAVFSCDQRVTTRRSRCLSKCLLLTATLITYTSSAMANSPTEQLHIEQDKPYQLLLAGGSLSTCSSYSTRNCRGHNFDDSAKTSILYEVNKASLDRLEIFLQNSAFEDVSLTLTPIIKLLRKEPKEDALTRRELFALFEEIDIIEQVDALSDKPYFALLDHLEKAQINQNGQRKKEVADVLSTENQYSVQIYQRFVDEVKALAKAANQPPHILVATSSSRDAFEVADFYESAFTSLGVKTTWLPIDQALITALSSGTETACQHLSQVRAQFDLFDRERVYPQRTALQTQVCDNPDMLMQWVQNSQGIFFNGGDQSKTLASLFSPDGHAMPFWQAITNKVGAFEMIVGGTSAGTAVQAGRHFAQKPIPMISNGTSEFAVKRGVFPALAPSTRCNDTSCDSALFADDVTFMPTGGSGLFQLGTLDTHFSERDREGRLIALALSTQTPLAAGVDETTALLYSFNDGIANFEVIGEQGVFFVDGNNHARQQNLNQGKLASTYAGYSHYLFSGSRARFELATQAWQVTKGANAIESRKKLGEAAAGIWRNSTRRYCGSKEMTSWQIDGVDYVIAPEPATQFFIDADRKHCGYLYLPFVVSASNDIDL